MDVLSVLMISWRFCGRGLSDLMMRIVLREVLVLLNLGGVSGLKGLLLKLILLNLLGVLMLLRMNLSRLLRCGLSARKESLVWIRYIRIRCLFGL